MSRFGARGNAPVEELLRSFRTVVFLESSRIATHRARGGMDPGEIDVSAFEEHLIQDTLGPR